MAEGEPVSLADLDKLTQTLLEIDREERLKTLWNYVEIFNSRWTPQENYRELPESSTIPCTLKHRIFSNIPLILEVKRKKNTEPTDTTFSLILRQNQISAILCQITSQHPEGEGCFHTNLLNHKGKRASNAEISLYQTLLCIANDELEKRFDPKKYHSPS